jgi:16S rRNA (guanine1207-N2)-methyltransferase
MEHYYSSDPKVEYKEHELTAVVAGKKFELISSDGVFSKNNIDFGTLTLLNALYKRHKSIGTLLDIGCGYGIIGISAAIVAGAKSTMRDINKRAVELSCKNAEKNGVVADIKVGDGYQDVDKTFDIIVSNPPIRAGKKVYYPWIENAKYYLNEGGELWIVVQKKQGAPSIKKLMQNTFGNCEVVDKDAGYFILVSRREDDGVI